MALTVGQSRKEMARQGALGSAPVIARLLGEEVRRQLSTWTSSQPKPSPPQRIQRKAGKSKRKNQRQSGRGNISDVGRTISSGNSNSINMSFKDVFTIGSGSGGGGNGSLSFANVTTIGTNNCIGVVMPRFSTMCGMYRQFMLHNVKLSWIPYQPFTTAGSVALGVDQAVTATIPTQIGQVYRHNPSKLADIKVPVSIVWRAKEHAGKTEPKGTSLLAGLDEDAVSFGVAQWWIASNVASSPMLGLMEIDIDVTLLNPY